MKNAIAWADHLPEPYKSNMKKAVINMDLYASIKDALAGSFNWGRSALGFEYWNTVFHKADKLAKEYAEAKKKKPLNWKPLIYENLPKVHTLLLVRRGDKQALYLYKVYSPKYLYLKALSKGSALDLPLGNWITVNEKGHMIFNSPMYAGTEFTLLK